MFTTSMLVRMFISMSITFAFAVGIEFGIKCSSTAKNTTTVINSSELSPMSKSKNYFETISCQIAATEAEYCGHVCELQYVHSNRKKRLNCDYCRCDHLCFQYGDCCPDRALSMTPTIHLPDFSCVKATPDLNNFNSKFYYMIQACHGYINEGIVEKCVNSSLRSWDTQLHVVDERTGYSYKNRYCAECNGVTRYAHWLTKTICRQNEPRLTLATSTIDFFNIVLDSNVCYIEFVPLPHLREHKRECKRRESEIISTCNVTGKWGYFDPLVNHACGLFTHVVHKMYNNVFCYMCNVNLRWNEIVHEMDGGSPNVVDVLPLTALLDFGSDRQDINVKNVMRHLYRDCEDNEVFDEAFNKCRRVICHEGARFNGVVCVDTVSASNMYLHSVCWHVRVVLTNSVNSTREFLNIFNSAADMLFQNIHNHLSEFHWESYSVRPFAWQNCQTAQKFIIFHVAFSFFPTQPLKLTFVYDQLRTAMNLAFTNNISHREMSVHESLTCSSGYLPWTDCVSQVDYMVFERRWPVPVFIKYSLGQTVRLSYNAQSRCPRIALHRTEFQLSVEEHSSISFLNLSADRELYDELKSEFYVLAVDGQEDILSSSLFHIDNGSAIICLTNYQELLLKGTPYSQNLNKPLAVLSVVCTCISLVFLVVMFTLYCVLSDLRTSSGVTNMGLIVTLFCTQGLYEFGAEQNEVRNVCVIVGVAIHFLWLSVMFWMNACTIQLFLRLSFPLTWGRIPSTRSTLLRAALYSFIMPSVIVSINISIHYYIDGNIGYGGQVCYINTASGRQFAFGLPLAGVVLVNITLYAITILRMKKQMTYIQKNKESSINLVACVKLSAITGVSWTFAFIYEATRLPVFAYIFTILVGGQGIFLFLIFMNKNVVKTLKIHVHDSCSRLHVREVSTRSRTDSSRL